jgi:hypothetical protein
MDLKNFVKVNKTGINFQDEELVNDFDIIQSEKELELFLHNLDKLEIVIDQLENNQLDKPLAKMLIYYGVDEELKNNNVSISLQDYLNDKVSEGEIVDVINNVLVDILAMYLSNFLNKKGIIMVEGYRRHLIILKKGLETVRDVKTIKFDKKYAIPDYGVTMKFFDNCMKVNRDAITAIMKKSWEKNNMDFKNLGIFYEMYKDIFVQEVVGGSIKLDPNKRIQFSRNIISFNKQQKTAEELGYNEGNIGKLVDLTKKSSEHLLLIYGNKFFDTLGSISKKYNDDFKKFMEEKSKEEIKEKKKAMIWAQKQTVFFMKELVNNYKVISTGVLQLYSSGKKA